MQENLTKWNFIPHDENLYIKIINEARKWKKYDRKNKMTKISEVAPIVSVFEGSKKISKENIVDKDIKILAFAGMTSEDGEYSIGLIEVDGKTMTTTFSGMITDRLVTALGKVGQDTSKGNAKELYFKDAVEGKLSLKESQKNPNRKFYVLE